MRITTEVNRNAKCWNAKNLLKIGFIFLMENSLLMRFNCMCLALCPPWNSILLCFLQGSAVSALLQRTSLIRPSVWTTGGVWMESASRSVKLWRTCSHVLVMVKWPADKANTVGIMQLHFLKPVLSRHAFFFLTLPVCYFSETKNSCKVCCRDKTAVCTPYIDDKGNPLLLRKGKPCTVGFCDGSVSGSVHNIQSQINCSSSQDNWKWFTFSYLKICSYSFQGKCMKQVQDVIERLWDFIEKLDINTFGKLSVNTVI